MSRIHIMPEVLASQVAAGEVVERPASVIKELVENSLDAGAKTISVEIQRGGFARMKVTDDGCGMSREDALLSVERHATSKLLTVEELFEISHLGFRGEALPSIASVSRLGISTREPDAIEGCEVQVEGGVIREPRVCGMAPGTSIDVADLFFNTPARKKFLKSEETEAAHIEHQIRLHALAFPTVRFLFKKNGQFCFDLPGTDDFRVRIAALSDPDSASRLVRIAPQYGPGVTVHGYLLPLSESRKTKKGQFIFLNNRPIEDKLVTRAIRDGYGGLPTGLHPSLYLYLDIEPVLVDVNVHPSKREVRFRRPSDIVTTIIDAVSQTLAGMAKNEARPPEQTGEEASPAIEEGEKITPPAADPIEIPSSSAPQRPPIEPFHTVSPARSVRPLPPTQRELTLERPAGKPAEPPFPFRLIGTLNNRYGLFESEDGLVLLYPRAARERIIFENLMEYKEHGVKSQTLLEPILIEPDPRDYAMLMEWQNHFDMAGISLHPFGQRTIRIESIPAMLKLDDVKAFILDLVDRVTQSEYTKKASRLTHEHFVCELALRSSRLEKINLTHIVPLLKELLQCEVPYCTPSGKPTLVLYSRQEIAKKFGL